MDFTEYQREAMVTDAPGQSARDRMLMGAIGLAGEAGEVADEIKKVVFHDKAWDTGRLVREAGDVLWYLAHLARTLGVSLEDIAKQNITKLRARHGGGAFKTHRDQSREELPE